MKSRLVMIYRRGRYPDVRPVCEHCYRQAATVGRLCDRCLAESIFIGVAERLTRLLRASGRAA